MYEMLMVQNAQMHQMIMQQLMLSTISRPPRPPPAPAAAAAANSTDEALVTVDIKDLIEVTDGRLCAVSFAGPHQMYMCIIAVDEPGVRRSICHAV